MGKWKLLIRSLPIVIVVLAIKITLTEVIQFKGLIELSEMGVILTGGIFLMGFMLAGTMADYKESEKIPGELAISCETIEETLLLTLHTNDEKFNKAVKHSFKELITDINTWILNIEKKEIYKNLDKFRTTLLSIEPLVPANAYIKLVNDFQNIRKIITRVNVISITGFIETGYALLELIMVLIGLLLMITIFKNTIGEIVIVFFVSLIFLYMYQLIRDIDNPFEYDENQKGVTEVSLFPLKDYLERADERLK